jgi:hypothetical protein
VSIDAPAGTPIKPTKPTSTVKKPPAKKVPTFPTPPSPKTQKAAQNSKAVVPFDQGSKANTISSANAAASSDTKDSGKQVYNKPPDNAQAQQIMPPPQATPQTVVVPQQGKSTKQLDLGDDDLTPQQAPTKKKK